MGPLVDPLVGPLVGQISLSPALCVVHLDICLDMLPRAPPPILAKPDAQHMLSLQVLGTEKVLSIAKNHPKTSQKFSEQFGPPTHKIKGFGKNSHRKVHPNFLLRILFPFFVLSTPPFPSQVSSPKSPLSGTPDLLFVVEKRQPAGAGFWGRFWMGSPHRKNKIFFFSLSGVRKKGEFPRYESPVLPQSKCSKSRDLTAIAICDSNRESQIANH